METATTEQAQAATADTPIAPGDVVQLKSGGPWMTVASLDEEGQAKVFYIGADGAIDWEKLPTAVLRKKAPAADDR